MHKNPYDAPTSIKSQSFSQQASENAYALSRLRPPAIGIIIVSILSVINIVLGAVIQNLAGQFQPNQYTPVETTKAITLVALMLIHFVYVYAGVLMLKARNRKSIVLALKLACVPCCSPLIVLGIPVAIWGLNEIKNPRVKGVFNANELKSAPENAVEVTEPQPTQMQATRTMQIVGKKCSVCGDHIILASDGQFCPSCLNPFCTNCLENNSKCAGCGATNVQN